MDLRLREYIRQINKVLKLNMKLKDKNDFENYIKDVTKLIAEYNEKYGTNLKIS